MMQTITNIGLDIAKVFQVHCVDADGNVVLRCQLKRRYVPAFFQKWPSFRVLHCAYQEDEPPMMTVASGRFALITA
jgi:hypothetical protein